MQHFAAALHLSDVITKVHALPLVGIIERFEQVAPSSISFELARATSTGAWVAAVRDAAVRVRPAMVADSDAQEWLAEMRRWLTRKRGRPDEEALEEVLEPLTRLSESLSRGSADEGPKGTPKTPVDLMQTLVEIRNKTTGHHAYGPDFWSANVDGVVRAVEWIQDASPLWRLVPALPLTRGGKRMARLLLGVEPSRTIEVGSLEEWGDAPLCLLDSEPLASLGQLAWVDPATNLTYLANGGWRDSDSTAEFLCHSIEASQPGEGCKRLELPAFAIRPPALPPSETEGEEALVLDAEVVPHNLPPPIAGYIERGALEETTRGYLLDAKRRHLINVRGPGGFGKTSLVLMLCHELVSDPETCPYDAVIWMSARDVDLTLRGATEVRRAEESLSDVWRRYARLFGETDDGVARDFFETSLREEPVLLILDNFETFDEQEVAYRYLDDLVQPPAKAVITSRHVFKGDYAVEVKGMLEDEAEQLLVQAARAAGVEPLMSPRVRQKIFERCQGHPYAMKLVASQVKSEAGLTDLLHQVLRKGDLLDALFRRSVHDLGEDEDAVFMFLLVGQFVGGISEPAARTIIEPASVDLDKAVTALLHRSLIDIGTDGSYVRYDMPAMAREFAQQHIAGHLLQTEIAAAVQFLRRWPSLLQGRVTEAADAIARDLRGGVLLRAERDRALEALRILTSFDPAVWALLARAQRETGAPESDWEDAYKRAIEVDPGRADLLFEWSEATSDFDRQVELKVQAVSADRGNIALASKVAHFLNSLYSRERARYQPVKWAALMGRVIDVLDASFLELDGEALSRLAWLYIHSGRSNEARRVVERGLIVDFENESLRKLATRQKIKF
jgi:NB-ARC domain